MSGFLFLMGSAIVYLTKSSSFVEVFKVGVGSCICWVVFVEVALGRRGTRRKLGWRSKTLPLVCVLQNTLPSRPSPPTD